MSFYTRRGDTGQTDLLGERVGKDDVRIETLGARDEASSALGLARAAARQERSRTLLTDVQRDLYKLMAELAFTTEQYPQRVVIGAERVDWLESETDALTADAPPPRDFVLPGESPQGAALDWARVTARRAERRLVALDAAGQVRNPEALRYLNRLSSLLFALARWEEHAAGVGPTIAKTGERGEA